MDPDHEEDDESEQNLYCLSFRKKKGPMADFLSTIKEFRQTVSKLNNAERQETTVL